MYNKFGFVVDKVTDADVSTIKSTPEKDTATVLTPIYDDLGWIEEGFLSL